jgi:hypothetical protein
LLIFVIKGLFVAAQEEQEYNSFEVDATFNTGDFFNGGTGRALGLVRDHDDDKIIVFGYFESFFAEYRFSGRIYKNNGLQDDSWNSGYGGILFGTHEVKPFLDSYLFTLQGTGMGQTTANGMNSFLITGEYFLECTGYPPDSICHYNGIQTFHVIEGDSQNQVLVALRTSLDSLNPNRTQHLVRVFSNGDHDNSFPLIECEPNFGNTAIYKIEPLDNGKWLVAGKFTGINDHNTINLARLNSDFSVDTTFISPALFPGIGSYIHLIDDQQRIWASGIILSEDEPDPFDATLNRLLPNGEIDTAFHTPALDVNHAYDTTDGWGQKSISGVLPLDDNFVTYGTFATYNDTVRNCIAMINDQGHLVSGYFEGLAADTANTETGGSEPTHPRIMDVLKLEDSSLILAGQFDRFDGVEHHSVVKLKPVHVGVEEHHTNHQNLFKVFPNPADERVQVKFENHLSEAPKSISIIDLQGRVLQERSLSSSPHEIEISVSNIPNGVYFLKVKSSSGILTQRLLIQH